MRRPRFSAVTRLGRISRHKRATFNGAYTNRIYRGRSGSRAAVVQKHAETRSKCQFEAIWGPAGPIERRSIELVYRTWALTTCTEAFVLLVAALAPFRSFSTRAAGLPTDYQKEHASKRGCSVARNIIGQLLNDSRCRECAFSKSAQS